MGVQGEKTRPGIISRVEIFLIVTIISFGGLMIVMTPLGAGYDEDQHFYRTWQLSNLKMLPEEQSWRQSKFPNIYMELSYRKQPLVESVGFDYWGKYGNLKLYDRGYYYGSINTRSRYSPPLLLPQALALRYSVGRFNLPALATYYLARLAGLLVYAILAWLAVRITPFGKWTLTTLAIAPMAVYQASTISADTITNGIGFLFFGGSLAMAVKSEIRFKELGLMLLLVFLLFLSKPNIYPLVLLPFLLLRPSNFQKRYLYALWVVGTVILFGIEFVGWNVISPNPGFSPEGNVNASEQLVYILTNPLAFIKIIVNDLWLAGPRYLAQWIGVYGYDYGTVPAPTYVFFLVAVSMSLFLDGPPNPGQKTRLNLLLVFFLCYLATLTSLYLTFTSVKESFVYGVQGRYFIPIFPALFLALYKLPPIRGWRPADAIVGAISLISLLSFTGGLVSTYHITCGSAYYRMGLCYQPTYKNFSPLTASSPPISDRTKLVQEIAPVCNGMTDIQIRVNSPGNASNGQIEFILSNKKGDRVLLKDRVNNTDLPEDGWYKMDFNPEWESAGQVYILTVLGIGSSAYEAPLLAYSIRPEYPLGNLIENGNAVENDIIFQYGCLVGVQKLWDSIYP